MVKCRCGVIMRCAEDARRHLKAHDDWQIISHRPRAVWANRRPGTHEVFKETLRARTRRT